MPYMIATFDKPNREHVRDSLRGAHLEWLESHVDKVIAGGGFLTDDGNNVIGGIMMVDIDSAEEARAFIANDPFMGSDLFERVEIVRWRPSFLAFKRLVTGAPLKP